MTLKRTKHENNHASRVRVIGMKNGGQNGKIAGHRTIVSLQDTIHLLHGYCSVDEIRQLRIVSNAIYEAIARCDDIGARLQYSVCKENMNTPPRRAFNKIGLCITWKEVQLDRPSINNFAVAYDHLHITNFDSPAIYLTRLPLVKLIIAAPVGAPTLLKSIELPDSVQQLALHNISMDEVLLSQITSHDVVSLTLMNLTITSGNYQLDLSGMSHLKHLQLKVHFEVVVVKLPQSIESLHLKQLFGGLPKLANLPRLKDVWLTDCCQDEALDLYDTNIKQLLLSARESICYDFIRLPRSLKELHVQNIGLNHPLQFDLCQELQVLYMAYFDREVKNVAFDLASTALKDVEINSLASLRISSFILPPTMQRLHIEGCTLQKSIELSDFKDLIDVKMDIPVDSDDESSW